MRGERGEGNGELEIVGGPNDVRPAP